MVAGVIAWAAVLTSIYVGIPQHFELAARWVLLLVVPQHFAGVAWSAVPRISPAPVWLIRMVRTVRTNKDCAISERFRPCSTIRRRFKPIPFVRIVRNIFRPKPAKWRFHLL